MYLQDHFGSQVTSDYFRIDFNHSQLDHLRRSPLDWHIDSHSFGSFPAHAYITVAIPNRPATTQDGFHIFFGTRLLQCAVNVIPNTCILFKIGINQILSLGMR